MLNKFLLISMRKLRLFFAVAAFLVTAIAVSYGQPYPVKIAVNLNQFDVKSGKTGLGFSVSVSRLYFDMATNFATGDGANRERTSPDTYKLEKMRIGIINGGYVIPISKFFIIPKVGIAWSFDILQNIHPEPTYYMYNENDHFNFGIVGGYHLNDKFSVKVGAGSFERFTLGIQYYLGDY